MHLKTYWSQKAFSGHTTDDLHTYHPHTYIHTYAPKKILVAESLFWPYNRRPPRHPHDIDGLGRVRLRYVYKYIYIYIYIWSNVCMHLDMYVCIYWLGRSMHACMHTFMLFEPTDDLPFPYVCMYVCMYACMNVMFAF